MKHKNKLNNTTCPFTLKTRLRGDQARNELISHLLSSNLCHNMIGMSPRAFLGLCDILVREWDLRPTLQVPIEEQLQGW